MTASIAAADAERDDLARKLMATDQGAELRNLIARLTQLALPPNGKRAVYQLLCSADTEHLSRYSRYRYDKTVVKHDCLDWFFLVASKHADALLEEGARRTACEMLRIGLLSP